MPILDDVTSPSSDASQRARRRDRGATMVEFGIIAVALFSLIFGIIEGAFAVRARNTVNNAVDDAARRGAVAGSSQNADWLILNQLVGRGAADAATIEYVVVYRATSGSAPVPTSCLGTPQTNLCNVYGPATIENIESKEALFDCVQLSTSWCPTTRALVDDIGFLGVYVKARYEPIVDQLFVDMSFDVDANSLQAIESSGDFGS